MSGKNNRKKQQKKHEFLLATTRKKMEEQKKKRSKRKENKQVLNELVEMGSKLRVDPAKKKELVFLEKNTEMTTDLGRTRSESKGIAKKSRRKDDDRRKRKMLNRMAQQGKMVD